MNRRKGQSILEYVIVLTVIVAAIAVAAGSAIKPAVEKAMGSANTTISTAATNLPGSR